LGHKAIVLAIGAYELPKIGIPGEYTRDVTQGVPFLRQVSLSQELESGGGQVVGRRVLLGDGGNTAPPFVLLK
jgi:NADPH-dependent glutamate synthase beta subunit-like oxidoreductase